jgi:succinyl-diaminopimelate desuccinylase
MKSAAAAEILVFKELASKVRYPLGLQLVTDEETGGFNGAKYQASRGVRTECMIAGESSSDLTMSIQAKGVIGMKIEFTGMTGHAAYPWEGRNAIRDLNLFLSKLWKQYPIPAKKVWKTTVNAAIVGTTNLTSNKIPGDAMCRLDIRYLPGEGDKTINKIKSWLPENATVEIPEHEPARNTPENDKYVQRFLKTAKKSLNRTVPIIGKNGASDVRHYPDAAGVEFGPVGAGPHADNEWVDIKSLQTFSKILKDFLLSFPEK